MDEEPRPPCGCRLCARSDEELDEHDRKLLADVERHGWHVVLIPSQDNIPGWAFTVGLTHSFGTPEQAMFGLSTDVMHTCLNILGEVARENGRMEPGERNPDVLTGYDVELRAVDPAWHAALFGYAQWFYRPQTPRSYSASGPGARAGSPGTPSSRSGSSASSPSCGRGRLRPGTVLGGPGGTPTVGRDGRVPAGSCS